MNTSTTSLWAPFARFLANPSLVALVAFGISLIAIFYFLGEWLLPVIISIALAYLLEGIIGKLERHGARPPRAGGECVPGHVPGAYPAQICWHTHSK